VGEYLGWYQEIMKRWKVEHSVTVSDRLHPWRFLNQNSKFEINLCAVQP
jgi:hypothetical protein